MPLAGQDLNFHFDHLSQENGLEQTQNAFLFKDSKGLLWISSLEDIFVFDGEKVVEVSSYYRPGSWQRTAKNVQSRFLEDGNHTIWFTTYTELCRFNWCTNEFSALRVADSEGDTIQDNYRLIHLQGDSLLWLAAGDELYRYPTVGNAGSTRVGTFGGVRFAIDTSRSGELERIFSSPWFSRNGFDVYSFSEGEIVEKATFFAGDDPRFPPLKISQLLFENDSLLWLCSDQGLIEFNPRRPAEFTVHRLSDSKQAFSIRNGIRFDDQHLLLSVTSQGLWLFEKSTGRFTQNWRYDPNRPFSPTSNDPKEIYMDPEGGIWVSHYGEGVDHLFPGQIKFNTSFKGAPSAAGNPSYFIHHIVEGKDGDIWGGTMDQGLIKVDLNKNELVEKPLPDPAPAVSRINSISRSGHYGVIWVVTDRSVLAYDENGRHFLTISPQEGERFRSVVQVGASEALVSTNAGIRKVDFSGPAVLYTIPAGLPPEIKADELDFLFADAKGNLFFPFESRDLLIFEYKQDGLKLKKKLGLNALINYFFDDEKEQCIWLGTSNGLIRLDTRDFSFVQLDESSGLPPGAIYGVLPDDRGHLWLSTHEGLLDYNPEAGTYYHYHAEEGLQSNEFSRFSALRTADGRLWFGGPNGLNGFFPDSIRPYPHPPQVAIENLQVNDEPFVVEDCQAAMPEISLRYWQNTLSFDLFAFCYYLPQYNRLRYRIRSYDDEWSEVKSGATVRLFRLPPGEYGLEVIAVNANNVAGELRTMTFRIYPPFWQTLWFRLLAVAALGALVYGSVRVYIRRRLRLHQIEIDRQNALQAERNRIAAELHDDLGSGLSIIRYLSEHARRHETDAKQRSQIERISQSSRDLIEKMGDIIWAMNSENDQLDNLLFHLQDYAEDYLADNNLDCDFHLPSQIPPRELSGERRRNILLTVKETLHNIVKHAGATSVTVEVSLNGGLAVRIRDNGRGVDLEQLRRGGNGLKNMAKRMTAIGGEFRIFNDQGTVVELEVPLPKIK